MLRTFGKIMNKTSFSCSEKIISLHYKFLLPFNESNKESSLQDKIIKQRLNQKISLSLQQNKPKDSIEDDPTSSSDTPTFLEKGFNIMMIPTGVFSLNLLFNQYNTTLYMSCLCMLTDWLSCVTAGYTGIYFAMACLRYNKSKINDQTYNEKYKYNLCVPTILALNVSIFLIYKFNYYFFAPISFALMFSFINDFSMVKELALPRYFMNFKIKLILITNFIVMVIVFSLMNCVGFNRKMFGLKQELEHTIALNRENYEKEDEEIEKKQAILMEKLKNPAL